MESQQKFLFKERSEKTFLAPFYIHMTKTFMQIIVLTGFFTRFLLSGHGTRCLQNVLSDCHSFRAHVPNQTYWERHDVICFILCLLRVCRSMRSGSGTITLA